MNFTAPLTPWEVRIELYKLIIIVISKNFIVPHWILIVLWLLNVTNKCLFSIFTHSLPTIKKTPPFQGNDAATWLLSTKIPVQMSIISSAAWKLNLSSTSHVVWQIWFQACAQFKIWVLVLSPVIFGSQFDFFFEFVGHLMVFLWIRKDFS